MRSVPFDACFVLPDHDLTKQNVPAPGELVTAVTVPPVATGTRSVSRKVRTRGSWDFALAAAAVTLQLDRGRVRAARIVLGAAAPVPWRAREVETALTGQRLDTAAIQRAAAAAGTRATPLEHNGYKIPMLRGVVEEALATLAA